MHCRIHHQLCPLCLFIQEFLRITQSHLFQAFHQVQELTHSCHPLFTSGRLGPWPSEGFYHQPQQKSLWKSPLAKPPDTLLVRQGEIPSRSGDRREDENSDKSVDTSPEDEADKAFVDEDEKDEEPWPECSPLGESGDPRPNRQVLVCA